MANICGLDFGTSNSTIGIVHQAKCQLAILENKKPIIRSAIFCDTEAKEWVFGQEGITRYLESTPGRLMMSLKSVLGSQLMNDKTHIFNEYIPYTQVLSRFIRHIKTKAEATLNQELTHVVMGRPVHFHDHDKDKDQLAQQTLKDIAIELGFKEVIFQYEPIAAAIAYEASLEKEKLALIIDMGGGTSDFTIIRLHTGKKDIDRSNDVLANCGIHIAGTDFDQRLSIHTVMPLLGLGTLMRGSSSDIPLPSMLYHDLTTWHTINNNYTSAHISHVNSIKAIAYDKPAIDRLIRVLKKREAHHIMNVVEIAKQQLSDTTRVTMDMNFIEADLSLSLERKIVNDVIENDIQKIIETIKQAVSDAHLQFADINTIFYTGGSTKIPVIRERINTLFPQADVVQGDAFGSVGLGLTIDAHRRFS
jgi:hypothetical chaperone protein